jgi:hypothetical protein
MASPLPATVRVAILPKLTATIEALDVLSQAFQDIADALLVARDTLRNVEDDDGDGESDRATPQPSLHARFCTCGGSSDGDVHATYCGLFADIPSNAGSTT